MSTVPEIPNDVPKMRQPPKSARTLLPSHLSLEDAERQQLQMHLDLVGIDRHHFLHNLEDQSECMLYQQDAIDDMSIRLSISDAERLRSSHP